MKDDDDDKDDVEREVDRAIPRGDLEDNVTRAALTMMLRNSRGRRPQVSGSTYQLRNEAYRIVGQTRPD